MQDYLRGEKVEALLFIHGQVAELTRGLLRAPAEIAIVATKPTLDLCSLEDDQPSIVLRRRP